MPIFGQLLLRVLLVSLVSLLAFFLGIYVIRKIAAKRWGVITTTREAIHDNLAHTKQMVRQAWEWTRQTKSKAPVTPIKYVIPPPSTRERITKAGKIVGMLVVALLVGFNAGFGYRDHQLTSKIVTYTDVYVREKINDKRFIVQPRWMQKMDVDLCKSSTVDWNAGETLTDWTFEQRPDCKRVIIYHKNKGEKLNASLQTR